MKISSMTSHQIRVAGALVMGLAVTATWAQTEKAIAIAARSDTGLRPEVAERKTVPLAGLIDQAPSTLRLSVQNRKIAMPNEATRVMAVSVCQGMVASKEQARAGGTICASVAGARNAQLADATAPQSDAFRAMQKAKSIQEEAAPELLPASDGLVRPIPHGSRAKLSALRHWF